MRPLAVLPLLAIGWFWWLALAAWPTLPDRIPIHFDAAGNPDDYCARSWPAWFALPALGTLCTLGLGQALPALVRRLARANSPWWNVPQRASVRQLPVAGRLAVARAANDVLAVMAIEVGLLFAVLVDGIAAVAVGQHATLPVWPTFVLIGMIVVTAFAGIPHQRRAVARELARTPAATSTAASPR